MLRRFRELDFCFVWGNGDLERLCLSQGWGSSALRVNQRRVFKFSSGCLTPALGSTRACIHLWHGWSTRKVRNRSQRLFQWVLAARTSRLLSRHLLSEFLPVSGCGMPANLRELEKQRCTSAFSAQPLSCRWCSHCILSSSTSSHCCVSSTRFQVKWSAFWSGSKPCEAGIQTLCGKGGLANSSGRLCCQRLVTTAVHKAWNLRFIGNWV